MVTHALSGRHTLVAVFMCVLFISNTESQTQMKNEVVMMLQNQYLVYFSKLLITICEQYIRLWIKLKSCVHKCVLKQCFLSALFIIEYALHFMLIKGKFMVENQYYPYIYTLHPHCFL